jgi:type IV pilus assembly protein PilC
MPTLSMKNPKENSAKTKKGSLDKTTLSQESTSTKKKTTSSFNNLFMRRSVGSREIAVFTRQLAATLKAGLLLTEALETVGEDQENPFFTKVIRIVMQDIRGGLSFSQALARHPKIFAASYVAIIKSGEASGRLDKTVDSLAKYLEASERLKEKVKSALIYPTFVVGFAMFVVAIIVFFLIPKFKQTFDSFHAKLPLITRIVIGTSEVAVKYAGFFIVGIILAVMAFIYCRRFPKFNHYIDILKLKIPFLGKHVIQKSLIARFCRTLGFLLSAGVGLSPSLEITSKVLDHSLFANSIANIHQRILGGVHLSAEIRNHTIFPKLVSKMAAVGERSGQIPQMLLQTAEYYEDELEHTLHKLTTLLEPILIVFIGGVVLIVVLALYLPIFKMATVIK